MFIVGHFDVWVVGGGTVGFEVRVGLGGCGGCLLDGFTGFALLVLCGGFFEEGFAVAFDGFLVFLANLGWICDASVFVIAVYKLLGGLKSSLDIIHKRPNDSVRTYLFGKTLQIVFRKLMLELIYHMLDSRVQLISNWRQYTRFA